jgi:Tol biopolymer transport system component
MKRASLTIAVLALGAWSFAELRPEFSTDAAARSAEAAVLNDTGRVVTRRMLKLPPRAATRQISVTPDGRHIGVGAGGGQEHIVLLDLETREIIEIPVDPPVASDGQRFTSKPVPSSDGEWLAYSEGYVGESSNRVRIARRNGSGARTLYSGSMGTVYPSSWSPDGGLIAGMLYREGSFGLALVDVKEAQVRVLKSTGWRFLNDPTFSPDGRFIAYTSQPDSASGPDIFVIAADGSRETPVVQHPARDELLGWTPDGEALVFRSDRRGTSDLWALSIDDGRVVGAPVLVVPEASRNRMVGFTDSGNFVYEVRVGRPASYVATMATPDARSVQGATMTARSWDAARWSPDGRYLAFMDPEARGLTIQAEATGAERKVPVSSLRSFRWPSWSPDGRALVVQAWDTRNRNAVTRIDVETGALTELAQSMARDGQTEMSTPVLSADQSTLYFVSKNSSVVARDLRNGQAREVFAGPPDRPLVWQMALAPEGDRIGVAYGSTGMWVGLSNTIAVVNLEGGRREIVRAEPGEHFRDLRWTPDGRSLVFLKSSASGVAELWRVAATGGPAAPIQFPDGIPHISSLGNFHPDGRRFTYVSRGVSEIWVMEGLAGAVREALGSAETEGR